MGRATEVFATDRISRPTMILGSIPYTTGGF